MRIAYLAGPADALHIFSEWSDGTRQQYFGTDYFKQFLQLAEDIGADCYAVTWNGAPYKRKLGRFFFDNRSMPIGKGLFYYLRQFWWHVKLIPDLVRFKPDLFILTGNQNFWWTLAAVPGKRLPSYHSVLLPKIGRVGWPWRALAALDGLLVLRRCKVIVVTSKDIADQVRRFTNAEIISHLPTYSPKQFADITPSTWTDEFRIIFVGRVVENKGIFDLLEMARRLPQIQFDVCGDGDALTRARRAAPANVTFHGFCDQPKLRAIMGRSTAAIVPTRSDCEAGFEMTCAEAILAGRPLITSAVCPALEYVRAASVEVKPDDVAGYVDAITELSLDRRLYERKREACLSLQAQFYDEGNSWLVSMKKAIHRLITETR